MTPVTRSSSSKVPDTLISQHPYPEPLHEYLSKAVRGHAEIAAKVADDQAAAAAGLEHHSQGWRGATVQGG
jgi:hypothetical protein